MDRRGYKEYIAVLAVLWADQINRATSKAANDVTNAVGRMESRLNSLNLIREHDMTHARGGGLDIGVTQYQIQRDKMQIKKC